MADDELQIKVSETKSLSPRQMQAVLTLFAANYDEADPAYIEKSVDTLKYIALATISSRLVGFGFGETRVTPLPRLSTSESVALAGMSCVLPNVRQRGLFSQMAFHVLSEGGNIPTDRPYLFCGRMAHAISYRTIEKMSPACVPKAGIPLTEWHQEMLIAAANAFGVAVDKRTGLVKGSGRPVGYPRLEFDPTQKERLLFKDVDRANGDSLLALAWLPAAPPGW
ncbi:MAG: hypothetical protein AAGG45_07000 [Pseudomonadota bacterium]